VQIRRMQPPAPGEVPPQDQLVHTRLPDVLDKEKVVAVMRATDKKRDTIAAFRNGTPKRIRYTTLVAICDAAYRKDPDSARISKVLVYTPGD
jgi:Cro/C1-type HTH DNA-binding domain